MYTEPIFCQKCEHLKLYHSAQNPLCMYYYCELERCELENKEDEAQIIAKKEIEHV